MKKFDHFLYGFIPGLLMPIGFLWIYLNRFYPADLTFIEILKQLYPSAMLGKLLLLSIMLNLVGVFIFYKQDSFRLGIGMMMGAMPYLIGALMMM
jgi:hypothetical protein